MSVCFIIDLNGCLVFLVMPYIWLTFEKKAYISCVQCFMFAKVLRFTYDVLLMIWCVWYFYMDNIYVWYMSLSSTLPEIDPDTAYVICISVSLGFCQKPSDTALLLEIALTTFNCTVSTSVNKGALVCLVVIVHWWRHRTHYDVTEAYHALCNVLTVHLNNGATRADLRGIPKHCEATAKAGRQSTIYGWFWCDFLYH